MLRNIFLVSLLVYAVSASHWEVREVDSAEDNLEEMPDDSMVKQQIFSKCKICKYITNMVRKRIPANATPEEIKTKLADICDKAKLMKKQCKSFVQHYLQGLIDELMTDDGPNKVCIKIKACKPKPTPIKEFIFGHDEAFNNL